MRFGLEEQNGRFEFPLDELPLFGLCVIRQGANDGMTTGSLTFDVPGKNCQFVSQSSSLIRT